MKSTCILAASVALISHAVVANEFHGAPDANVDLTVWQNDPVRLGDQTPWFVLDSLNQHCNQYTCDTEPWTLPASMTNKAAGTNSPNNMNEGTITVVVTDATIWADENVPALIETLKNLSSQSQIHSVETERYCNDDSLAPAPVARYMPRGVTCDRDGNPSIDQYSTAGTFYIRVNKGDGSLRSELRVSISAAVNDDALSQTLCSDLAGAGAAVAGALSGGALVGTGLSLAGLICGSI